MGDNLIFLTFFSLDPTVSKNLCPLCVEGAAGSFTPECPLCLGRNVGPLEETLSGPVQGGASGLNGITNSREARGSLKIGYGGLAPRVPTASLLDAS